MQKKWSATPALASLVLALNCGDPASSNSDPAGADGAPLIGLSRTTINISGTPGAGKPNAEIITISNAGGGTLSGLRGLISYSSSRTGWLSGEFTSATAPSQLILQADPGSLPAGTYTATVRISSSSATNSPQDIAVVFKVGGGGSGTTSGPTYLRNGVWITASWSSGKFEGPDTRRDVSDPTMPAGSYYPPRNIDIRKRRTGSQYGLFVIYPGQSTLVTYSCVGAGSAAQPSTSGIALLQCAVDVFDTPFSRLRRYAMTRTSSGTIDFMFYVTAGIEIKILYCRAGYVLTGPPTLAKVECVR